MFEIIYSLTTHAIVFIAGLLFDRYIIHAFFPRGGRAIEVNPKELTRVLVLLIFFVFFVAALTHAQFFGGGSPSLLVSLGGMFSFGSLVGERDFFMKLLLNITGKK